MGSPLMLEISPYMATVFFLMLWVALLMRSWLILMRTWLFLMLPLPSPPRPPLLRPSPQNLAIPYAHLLQPAPPFPPRLPHLPISNETEHSIYQNAT